LPIGREWGIGIGDWELEIFVRSLCILPTRCEYEQYPPLPTPHSLINRDICPQSVHIANTL